MSALEACGPVMSLEFRHVDHGRGPFFEVDPDVTQCHFTLVLNVPVFRQSGIWPFPYYGTPRTLIIVPRTLTYRPPLEPPAKHLQNSIEIPTGSSLQTPPGRPPLAAGQRESGETV